MYFWPLLIPNSTIFSILVVHSMWSPDLLHQHHLRACWNASFPELKCLKVWGGPSCLRFTISLGGFGAHWRRRASPASFPDSFHVHPAELLSFTHYASLSPDTGLCMCCFLCLSPTPHLAGSSSSLWLSFDVTSPGAPLPIPRALAGAWPKCLTVLCGNI